MLLCHSRIGGDWIYAYLSQGVSIDSMKERMMVQMTMDVSEELAKRLQPIRSWLPTVLELGMIGFKTLATQTASEVIAFLSTNPSSEEVLNYHASERAQVRMRQLLRLNQAGELGVEEQSELDELQKIEHILIMLKARVGKLPN